jgi:hypothetical protein
MTKGMVQVSGSTYRIVRIGHGTYEAVRLLDDECVGRFASGPPLQVQPLSGDQELVRRIAQTALRSGKTSWVGRLSFP